MRQCAFIWSPNSKPFHFMESFEVQPWSSLVRIPSTAVQVIAILTTIFRLLYRCRLSKLWWDDGWAVLALICGIACLACVWMEQAPSSDAIPGINIYANWITSVAITSVVWFARMSILASIVRIANPTSKLRRVAYAIGIMFLAMGAGLVTQKIVICIEGPCRFTPPLTITQLVTDAISDIILVVLPIWLFRGVKLSQGRRVLILSAFSASILITGVTILHSALLLQDPTSVTWLIGQIKAALALFVCNALVLATFVYRLCQKSSTGVDIGHATSAVEFTSVIDLPSKISSHAHSIAGSV